MAFTFHDNNAHHESLNTWMKRNIFIHREPFDRNVHVTMIGEPKQENSFVQE